MQKIKNKAWFLDYSDNFPSTICVMYDREKSPVRELDFRIAQPLDINKVQYVYFYAEPTPKATLDNILKWDFLPNSTMALLVNERALALLEEAAPGEFQAIQAQLIMPDGQVIKNYKLINILNRLPILNREKSILKEERFRRDWDLYNLHYYNRDKLGIFNLVKDDYRSVYFGSNKLRDAVKASGLKGLMFRESFGTSHFFVQDK